MFLSTPIWEWTFSLINGAWDTHVKRVVDSGISKVNQLYSVISNRDVNVSERRLLLLSVVRPTRVKCGRVISVKQRR